MLIISMCHDVHFTVLPSTTMSTRGPRCLFGRPDTQENLQIYREALHAERVRFTDRWGVDPWQEDKENNYERRVGDKSEPPPSKKRSNPYSRQTSIHDYWRARKTSDAIKKPLASSADGTKQQNVEPSKTMKATSLASTMITTTATTSTTTAKATKKAALN